MGGIVGPAGGGVTGHVVLDEGDKSSLSMRIMQDTIAAIAAELGTKPEALKKWRQRGVPHRLRLPIMLIAKERGIDLQIEAFEPGGASGGEQSEDSAATGTKSEAA